MVCKRPEHFAANDQRIDQRPNFYVYKTERYTFNEMYQRASSLAAELIEKYGISPGDRVAIGMRNYPEWPIAFTAITSIGAS